jgi:threonyl-tRNA synthetase
MIHRAPFGSMERFIGILIEHFAGEFPVWLAPKQVMVIPIGTEHFDYANEVVATLKAAGIRAEADLREKHMRSKIKEHRKMLIPYQLIVGERDVQERTVSVRLRTDEDKGAVSLEAFRDMVLGLVKSNSAELFPEPQLS